MEVDSECCIIGQIFPSLALRALSRRGKQHGITSTLLMHVTFLFLSKRICSDALVYSEAAAKEHRAFFSLTLILLLLLL